MTGFFSKNKYAKKCLFLWAFLASTSLFSLELRDSEGRWKSSLQSLFVLFDISPNVNDQALLEQLDRTWRQENKERWQMDTRFTEVADKALPFLKELGCVDTVVTQAQHHDYALLLGATGSVMQQRLDFLYEQYQQGIRFDTLVLLAGERDLNKAIEQFPPHLKYESDLLLHLYQHHPLFGKTPYQIIHSAKIIIEGEDGNCVVRRPNTEKTIRDWLLTKPKPGSCLAISNQPFVGYQEAVIKGLLPSTFSVTAIGNGAAVSTTTQVDPLTVQHKRSYPLSIYLDSLARWIEREQATAKTEQAGSFLDEKNISDTPRTN